MKADPEGRGRNTARPLTTREEAPIDQTHPCKEINSTTRKRCLFTDGGVEQEDEDTARADGGTTVQQILDENGVGQNNDYQGTGYAGSETAREAIRAYVDEHVADQVVASSRSIGNAVAVDVRVQEIGKTLGAHLDDRTPDGFLADVEVTKWRETEPTKWVFERVAGEADVRRSRRLQKPELVREISAATGADGARFMIAENDGAEWEKAAMTHEWMCDVLEAVCDTLAYEPPAVAEEPELTRREWIDELTQAGTTQVLARSAGIEDPGADTSWNKSTLQAIHELVVAGRDPSEVTG